MYCMLSSSQPLIRTLYLLILATRFESGQDLVMIEVLSFLFKGESFSFVRGLWLLDLIIERLFCGNFSGSALHLMFSNGDWKIFSFLAMWKFLGDLYFLFAIIVLPTRGRFGWSVFARGPQLVRLSSSWIRGFSLMSL